MSIIETPAGNLHFATARVLIELKKADKCLLTGDTIGMKAHMLNARYELEKCLEKFDSHEMGATKLLKSKGKIFSLTTKIA